MRRRDWLLGILGGWIVAAGPRPARAALDADTMKAALHTATPEEDGFIDHILVLVEAGRLRRSLVESTFQWARRKTKNRFQYFRRGLIVRAAAEGIVL